MGLCGALEKEGFKLGSDGLWHPPGWWKHPAGFETPEQQKDCVIALLRSELAGDRDKFIQVFGQRVADLLDAE